MNEYVATLIKKRAEHQDALRQYDIAIKALQSIYNHKWIADGHGHKDTFYKCAECGADESAMNNEEIIDTAKQLGITHFITPAGTKEMYCYEDDLITFARLIEAKVREELELRNICSVDRRSDQSVTVTFSSCRSCSAFEEAIRKGGAA